MDKHYGWQEGRGSQVPPGRGQNGQRWNERYRDDDRDMRSARGGESGGGWEQDDRRFTPSSGNLDRDDYLNEGEQYGAQRGTFGSRGQQWTQSARDQGRWSESGNRGESFRGQGSGNQGYSSGQGFGNQSYSGQGGYGSRGFSGGHYGGFANEGARNQSGWGQRGQNYGETFGRGYAGGEFGGQGFSGQSSGDQSYGSPSYGNQSSSGQGSRGEYGQGYAGRGLSGRGPKGYQRSDERIKEQLCERLTDDDDIDASEISIEVKNGEATLTGTVGSREEKRAAEELAERSPGVREVQNHLRVTQDRSSGQSGQFGQSGQSGRTGGGMSASSSRQDSMSKSQESTSGQSKGRNDRE